MIPHILKRFTFSALSRKPRLYIFAGQGTQQKGMLSRLLDIHEAKSHIQKLSNVLGYDFAQISTTDIQNLMNKTKITQPLLVLSQVLRFTYLHQNDLNENDYLIGHSIGQYSALCIAGSIDLQSCLKLVFKRGQLMEKHTKIGSGMLIIRFSDERKKEVEDILRENNLEIACYNSPNNVNIAGPLINLEKARDSLKIKKITCMFLPVSAAFHCNLLSQMVQPFEKQLQKVNFLKPRGLILRNLDTNIYESQKDIKQGLLKHLTNPVMFMQSIRKVNPAIECVEIGHNHIVKKYVDETRKKINSL